MARLTQMQLTNIRHTPTPLRCIILSATITLVFDLVNVASSAAFIALTSITVSALGVSFLIPIVLITVQRLLPTQGEGFTWGRWTMSLFGWRHPALGLITNLIAIISLLVNITFSFFPYSLPVTADSLNWSGPAILAFTAAGIIYWFSSGRKVYRGVVQEEDCFAVPVAIFL